MSNIIKQKVITYDRKTRKGNIQYTFTQQQKITTEYQAPDLEQAQFYR